MANWETWYRAQIQTRDPQNAPLGSHLTMNQTERDALRARLIYEVRITTYEVSIGSVKTTVRPLLEGGRRGSNSVEANHLFGTKYFRTAYEALVDLRQRLTNKQATLVRDLDETTKSLAAALSYPLPPTEETLST
jgi:hypothetical protein